MNRAQFTEYVAGTQRELRRFLVALCCGDSQLADDIAQETLIKAYLSCEGIRDAGRFKSWIYRIAYNTFISQKRSVRDTVGIEYAICELSEVSTDSQFRYQALYAALNKLPSKERTSVLLFYMEDYSIKEISDITGATQGAVRQHLSRGRNHLRTMLTNSKQDFSL